MYFPAITITTCISIYVYVTSLYGNGIVNASDVMSWNILFIMGISVLTFGDGWYKRFVRFIDRFNKVPGIKSNLTKKK